MCDNCDRLTNLLEEHKVMLSAHKMRERLLVAENAKHGLRYKMLQDKWAKENLGLAQERDELRERLKGIEDILFWSTDDKAPPYRHYGNEEIVRRIKLVIKKACEVKE